MRYTVMLAAALMLGWGLPAFGLEADQVRGRIVSVSPDEEQLRLRVQEAGDARHASPGQVNEYRIPADTEVRMEDPMESVLGARTLTLDDLEQGTQVLLSFEESGGEFVARDVAMGSDTSSDRTAASETQDEQQPQLAQSDYSERSRLPDTASILPMLMLGGMGFALTALAIRVLRRR